MNVVRHVLIRGRVQGVGYRAFVAYTALEHGLEGWVRNRRDGSVEAVFSGAAGAVGQMLDACRRGPSGSRVDGLDERDGTSAELRQRRAGERFSVLSTV
jgi:acylphosphatase